MHRRRSERPISLVSALGRWALRLPRPVKRVVMAGADAIFAPVCLALAAALKFDSLDGVMDVASSAYAIALVSLVVLNFLFGLYRSMVRFMGPQVVFGSAAAVILSGVAVAAVDRATASSVHPGSVFVIYSAIAMLYVAGSRFLARALFVRATTPGDVSRVAIYGAGDAGARLSSMIIGSSQFRLVAFIDDKRSLQAGRINGVRVHSAEELPRLVAGGQVDRVLLAIPSASRRRRREILSTLEPLGIHVQSMPELEDIISGAARIDELREVDVNDLLGRDPVPPVADLFASCIQGKTVLVTGAGGSIGSELCRQILSIGPKKLVLLEMSELALYNVERELRIRAELDRRNVEIVPLLGNAHHRHRMRDVLSAYSIQTVYHAAAYKHVPIVEHNVVEGIHNNVISTWYTAEAAMDAGVEVFVLISTDKAVNPTNVMGATKRMAELVLQALQQKSTSTRFCMVRFGNVLASSGSVVPLFREQIRHGGPVTVTHPDVIRYFMTIPEAAQLVIQAGSMATGGDVFVLDMGRPVKIDDLARRMISLMGFTVRDAANPDGDIEIKYTGLRAAEKLFEELLIGSNVAGTRHPMIMRAMEHSLTWEQMQALLNDLLAALSSFDCRRALTVLAEAVVEYKASPDLHDYVWNRRSHVTAEAAKVTDLVAKRRQADLGGQRH